MPYRLLAAALLLVAPIAATAAERTVYVASFDKVRLQGPFEVRITTGHAPAATLTGASAAIDGVEAHVDGTTLVLRNGARKWEQQPRGAAPQPVVVTLATPTLVTASVLGAGRIAIGRMKGDRLDLSVTGPGAISVDDMAADAANATLIGNGAITLAGRAGKVRLMTNGAGAIDAGGLDAGDLVVRLDGPGATRARARYTASVVNTGLGQVAVGGAAEMHGEGRCGWAGGMRGGALSIHPYPEHVPESAVSRTASQEAPAVGIAEPWTPEQVRGDEG